MDASDTRAAVLRAGVSEALTLAVAAVAEATTAQGGLRHAPRTIDLLRRAVVCRNFALPVYELCHLINALEACSGGRDGYVRLLFEGAASVASFKGRVEQALARRGGFRRAGVERTAQGLALRYRDGIFQVSWARMPFLAALAEFLVGALSYTDVDAALRGMLADPASAAAIRGAANRIASLLNRYLGQHLESEANGARFRQIVGFLAARDGGGLVLDDAAVLAFWVSECGRGDSELGLRAFGATFESFVALHRVLVFERTQQAAVGAAPLDAQAGIDPDPEAVADRLAGLMDKWVSPLHGFDETPVDRVKFFTGRERADLLLLMECGPQARQFPLSLLRSDVFGAVQARLVQALRRRAGEAERAGLIDAVDGSYGDRRTVYAGLEEHVKRLQKAALHALCRAPATGGEPAVVDLGTAREAEQAFKGFARQGFRDFDGKDPEMIEAFRQATEPLVRAGESLRAYLGVLASIDAAQPDLAGWFEADQPVFRDALRRLYRVTS
jgi:hypothetical protein